MTKERELIQWCIDQIFYGCDIDGGSFQDEAERLGILIKKKISQEEIDANPEKYELCIEYETDTLYYPYWSEEINDGED